ncbi:MAG: DUF6363 domain-containing protein, partial [Bacilli bacterium]
IPLNRSLQDGNTKNVIILTNPREYLRPPEKSLRLVKILYHRYPKLIQALSQRDVVYNDMLQKINTLEEEGQAFVIRPTKKLAVTRYTKDPKILLETYDQGYQDAQKAYEKLISFLTR